MKLLKFPNLRQTYEYDCGAQAMQSVLAYYGFDIREGIIMRIAETTRGGTKISGLTKVARKYGLKTSVRKMNVDKIKRYINKGIPVILFMQAWPDKKRRVINWLHEWDSGHYVVAIGYDKDRIYFEDPASFNIAYLTYDELKTRWHDSENGKKYENYGIAIYGKEPNFSPEKIVHMD
jgi:ABC-type bacteriocin/lantibiotic exporter with double-glycine peptidase domain